MRLSPAKLVIVFCFLCVPLALSLDAKSVYGKVSSATVLISDLDTHGTGIVLTSDGLILTNFHVVAAHIDLKAKLQVRFGSKTTLTEIENVKLVKIHPEYDLALLKAEVPANGTFTPAQMFPKNESLETGSKCYAIGNPGGLDGRSLDLSITEGLVSSARRTIDGHEFVQISAALNPGNSGGPVCDDQGRVFGITTWKLENTEGIGFAIPSQQLVLTDFIDPLQKKENAVDMKRAEDAGREFFNMAMQMTGVARANYLSLSAECYHLMAESAPSRPEPIYNLAFLSLKLGQRDVAKKYLQAVHDRDPSYGPAYHLRGVILMEENKSNIEEATRLWWKGVESGKSGVVECLGDLAVDMANQQKLVAAAYMLQWMETQASASHVTNISIPGLWGKINQKLPPGQVVAIRQIKSGFSKTDADLLAEGKLIAALAVVPNKAPAAAPAAPGSTDLAKPDKPKIDAIKIGSVNADHMADLVKRTRDKFAPQVVMLKEPVLAAPLPDEPQRVMLANLGWQLLLHFPNLAKLGVFNLASGKFDGYIDCPDPNALFAVGGNVLTLYLPSSELTELYDLNTLEKKVSKNCAYPGIPRFIGMGLLNPTRIFVLCEPNKEFPAVNNQCTAALINLPDWTPHALSIFGNGMSAFEDKLLEGGMDEAGVSSIVKAVQGGNGGNYYSLQTENSVAACRLSISIDKPFLTHDGTYVLSSRYFYKPGKDADFTNKITREGRANKMIAPVAGWPAYVEKVTSSSSQFSGRFPVSNRGGGMIPGRSPGAYPPGTYPPGTYPPGTYPPGTYPPGTYPPGGSAGHTTTPATSSGEEAFKGFWVRSLPSMTVSEEIPAGSIFTDSSATSSSDKFMPLFASAYSDRLVYINQKDKMIFVMPLRQHKSTGSDDSAKPGSHFERKLNLADAASVNVESGPKGLVYDAAKNTLSWNVPSDLKPGQVLQVILLVKSIDGKTSYKIERITVP